MENQLDIQLRPDTPADVPLILEFVHELAEYEKLAHEAVATQAQFHQALFGPKPAIVAVLAEADGEPAGFALFFTSFSTFVGKPGIYLEDLFVRPAFRHRGIARRQRQQRTGLTAERGH